MREEVESGGGSKGCQTGTGTGRRWVESGLGSGGCKMPAGTVCGATGTSGRCRGRAQFAKRCWGFSAPPTLVFFLLPDPPPKIIQEHLSYDLQHTDPSAILAGLVSVAIDIFKQIFSNTEIISNNNKSK